MFPEAHLTVMLAERTFWEKATTIHVFCRQERRRLPVRAPAQALRLPRVNLFIADDVGLGKIIEVELIVRELLLRRRIERIVIAYPPAMLDQCQDEMEARFGLTFAILDRAYVMRMRRPWNTHSRFLISHRLLIDETYASGLRDWPTEFTPQTLLILDEVHNAAPASGARYAIDAQITRAVPFCPTARRGSCPSDRAR